MFAMPHDDRPSLQIYTGELPLGDVNPVDLRELVMNSDIRPERPEEDDAPQMTDSVWQLAERCWAGDPRSRPTTDTVCADITRLLGAEERSAGTNKVHAAMQESVKKAPEDELQALDLETPPILGKHAASAVARPWEGEDRGEQVLGKEHPNTLSCLQDSADALHLKRMYAESEALYRRTLEGREKLLGKDHPDTLKTLYGLASAVFCQGRNEESERMFRQVVCGRECVLGKDHLDTISAVNNLANALYFQGRYQDCDALYRRAWKCRLKVLGSDHPDTLISGNNLANAAFCGGKYDEADALYGMVVEGRERVLGREHSHTVKVLEDWGRALGHQGRHSEAKMIMQKARARRRGRGGSPPGDKKPGQIRNSSVYHLGGSIHPQDT